MPWCSARPRPSPGMRSPTAAPASAAASRLQRGGEGLRRLAQRRAYAGDAAVLQHADVAVRAGTARGGDAFDRVAADVDGEHRHMAVDVGGEDELLTVRGPVARVRPRVERQRALAHRPAGDVDQRQRGRASPASASGSSGPPRALCRRETAAGSRCWCWSRLQACARHRSPCRSAGSRCRARDRRRPTARSPRPAGHRPRHRAPARSTTRACLRRQVDAVAAVRRIRDQMRVRHVVVLVQPVIPVPHRLLAEVARAGLLLAPLGRGLALLVVLDVRQHRRQQRERGRSLANWNDSTPSGSSVSCCGSPPSAGRIHTCIRFSASSSGLTSFGCRFDRKPSAPSWRKQGAVSLLSPRVS